MLIIVWAESRKSSLRRPSVTISLYINYRNEMPETEALKGQFTQKGKLYSLLICVISNSVVKSTVFGTSASV